MEKEASLHNNQVDLSAVLPVNLDVTTFPLHGHRLIEASAGTGKTYTIANLYLRLVLGHSGDTVKTVKPLKPGEILVVTFTDAATRELRQRIRKRIHTALEVFSGKQNAPAKDEDPLLYQLLQDISDHELATAILTFTERQMDEASIFTIHGFCHRMLNQYAFESGTLFNFTLTTEENNLLQQATNDFWRLWSASVDSKQAEEINRYWSGPEKLLQDLRPWISRTDLQLLLHPLPDRQTRSEQIKTTTAEVKRLWLTVKDELADLIARSDLCKRSYTKRNVANWIEKVTGWVESDADQPPEQLQKFTLTAFKKKVKENGSLPDHPVFQAIDAAVSLPDTFKDIFFKEALTGIRERFRLLKEQQKTLSFDDLLTKFSRAVKHKQNILLRKTIRNAFPVAIIDEFQDTDPVQYDIFNIIYPKENRDTGLFMIGDPKQAIYAFRGADIFTYINARRNTLSRFTLPTNWRSSQPMVNACNTIFSHSASPFVYNQDIPFSPTQAAPDAHLRFLQTESQRTSAITLWYQDADDHPVNKGTYAEVMTQITTEEIKRLLSLADQKQCMIHEAQEQRPLAASDIAILVRTGKQAEMIRQALADVGILSVYLSEKNSVFTTQEAKDLYRILKACLFYENERLVWAAIATALFGLDASELNQFTEDERTWEKILEEFYEYHQCWLKNGVLALVRRLLFKRHIAKSLLEQPFGERKLTDVIHLGDLLSFASQQLDSQQALLHWMWLRIQGSHDDPAHQLNLESDKNLVKVITIHKAKGLEYPVVFVPYMCDWKQAKKSGQGCFFHEEPDNKPTLDFTDNAKSYTLAEKERLAEDVRLFYVAITRSVYRCYLGIAPVRTGNFGKKETKTQINQTAIGHLLNITEAIEAKALPGIVQRAWCQNPQLIEFKPVELLAQTSPYTAPDTTDKQSFSVLPFNRLIENNWRVSSYSGLTPHHSSMSVAAHAIQQQVTDPQNIKLPEQLPQRTIFTFPKGAHAGTCLHSLFENLSFDQLNIQSPSEHISRLLLHYGFDPEWQQTLEQLVVDVLNAPLYGHDKQTPFYLRQISDNKKYAELEFYMPLSALDATTLNRLISEYDTLKGESTLLSFEKVKGMLKGFIDLVFVFDNRYYILDYKSNYLGDTLQDYSGENLSAAMKAHRYDFQYQLYTLAVHRLLRQRVKNYTYDTHMGGVFYLFLRGMRAAPEQNIGSPGVFFTRPQAEFVEKLDHLFAEGVLEC